MPSKKRSSTPVDERPTKRSSPASQQEEKELELPLTPPEICADEPETQKAAELSDAAEGVYESDSGEDSEDDSEIRRRAEVRGRSEAGRVDSIYLENFMNHRKLTVHLCPHVNFIHGQNGSGKSAILAALQMCLGARASVTHRGGSMGALVRSGHDGCAVVRVTLLNTGADAYEAKVFGDKITIERTFGKGANRYAIYNDQDHKITSDKKVLEAIIDKFNIQVENPVCILDQENSKEFIKGSPEQQYNFFRKATNLTRTRELIKEAESDIQHMEDTLATSNKQISTYREEYERTKQDYEELEAILGLEADIKQAKVNISWCYVRDHENTVEGLHGEVQQITGKFHELEKKLAERQQAAMSEGNTEHLIVQMEDATQELRVMERTVAELHKRFTEAKRPRDATIREIKEVTKVGQNLRKDKARLEREVKAANDERRRHAQGDERKLRDTLEQLRSAVEAKDAELRSLREATAGLLEEFEAARDVHQGAERECRGMHNAVSGIEKDVRMLQGSRQAPAKQFGQRVPEVLAAIQRHRGRFEGEVVGPVGQYINFRDAAHSKWAVAVTACIGKTLRNFVVGSQNDRKVLQGILRQVRAEEHTITVMKFAPRYNTASKSPAEGLLTVERVLSVSHDIAYNFLCETTGFETCALCNDPREQDACLEGRGNALRMVRNVSKAFDVNGSYQSVKNGNKFSIGYETRGIMKFGVNVDEQIATANLELDTLKAQLETRRSEIQGHLHDAQLKKKAWDENKKRIDLVLREKTQLEKKNTIERQKLQDLEADMAVDTSAQESELEAIRRSLEDLENDINGLKSQQKDQEVVIRDIEAEENEHRRTADTKRKAVERLEGRIKEAAIAAEKLNSQVEKTKAKVEQCAKVLDMKTKEVEEAQAQLDLVAQKATQYTQQQLGPDAKVPMKVPANRNADYFKSRVKQLEARQEEGLRKIPKERRTREAALERLYHAKQVYEEKSRDIARVVKNKEYLESDMKMRVRKWKMFQKEISKRTNTFFQMVLNRKNQDGKVFFDHKSKALRVEVTNHSQSQISNVKLLSGGERSYTTLSLLIALGQSLETPFRVMDEFDVFMDQPSRKVALDLLIQEGKERSSRQLILITPQDLSTVIQTNEVRIFKLPDPRRVLEGQTTLNFPASS